MVQGKQSNRANKGIATRREVECKEKEKGESGACVKFEPHFILDLGLFFLGVMVVSTTIFSLATTYTGAHNFFFRCNGLH
jgi:hypothetical protein